MCDRDLKIRVTRFGDKTYPSGGTFVTLRMNEWDPVSKIMSILRQDYGVPENSLKYLGVGAELLDLRMHDIAAAFNADVIRLSVDLEEKRRVSFNVMSATGKKIPIEADASGTIDSIKTAIEAKEGVPHSQQRLQFAGKDLADEHTLASCKIENGSLLRMLLRLRGGWRGGGGSQEFVDVSSDKHLHVRNWNPAAPAWRRACHGLSLEGHCPNRACTAFSEMVICRFGFGVTNALRAQCKCPMCDTTLLPKTCGFANCDWLCDGIKSNGTPVNLAWRTAGDAYHCFDTDGNMCEWDVLTIVCRRTELTPYKQELRLRNSDEDA